LSGSYCDGVRIAALNYSAYLLALGAPFLLEHDEEHFHFLYISHTQRMGDWFAISSKLFYLKTRHFLFLVSVKIQRNKNTKAKSL
jgi:hypothetical protein